MIISIKIKKRFERKRQPRCTPLLYLVPLPTLGCVVPSCPSHFSTMPRQQHRSKKKSRAYHTEIIAPGGGTAADIANLSKHLGIPTGAVQAIMSSGGRGVSRRSTSGGAAASNDDGAAAAAAAMAAAGASAWADFYAEASEDKDIGASTGGAKTSGATAATAAITAAAVADAHDEDASREYVLPILPLMAAPESEGKPKAKKTKIVDTAATYPYITPGRLAQTGTLDATVPGRTKRTLTKDYDLEEPTLLPLAAPAEDEEDEEEVEIETNPKFALIATSSTSCHSIAITTSGIAYGWGRNESNQLGLLSGSCPVVPLPTKLVGPWGDAPLVGAATGKSHSIVVDENGVAYGVGSNKCGQCGINSSIEDVTKFRRCIVGGGGAAAEDVEIVQVSCGEQFTVALTSRGHIYSAGLAEFGQLGNGETGEYFIAANKLGFANANRFERRAMFVQDDPSAVGGGGGKKGDLTNIPNCGEIAICSISCGKHHTIAVEAPNTSGHTPRVFSWGCGDYGCLGHGVQADEYTPRLISTLRGPLFAANYPVKASAGSSCSMVLTKQGHVYYMGKHRQIGEATMRPALIDALANNSHVATACAGGSATVFCTTRNAVTVSWGKGDTGDLGYGRGNQKSSAQPKFVDKLDSCMLSDVKCGYGHTLFLIKDEDAEDAKALKKLAKLEVEQVTL